MQKIKYLKSGAMSESSLQKAVLQWANLHPQLKNAVIHIPNEGKRTSHYGKPLKDMGMRRGVSDLFIALQRHGYGGAWIELKSKDGVLSQAQEVFLNDMAMHGYFTHTCYSLDEAIKIIPNNSLSISPSFMGKIRNSSFSFS